MGISWHFYRKKTVKSMIFIYFSEVKADEPLLQKKAKKELKYYNYLPPPNLKTVIRAAREVSERLMSAHKIIMNKCYYQIGQNGLLTIPISLYILANFYGLKMFAFNLKIDVFVSIDIQFIEVANIVKLKVL